MSKFRNALLLAVALLVALTSWSGHAGDPLGGGHSRRIGGPSERIAILATSRPATRTRTLVRKNTAASVTTGFRTILSIDPHPRLVRAARLALTLPPYWASVHLLI